MYHRPFRSTPTASASSPAQNTHSSYLLKCPKGNLNIRGMHATCLKNRLKEINTYFLQRVTVGWTNLCGQQQQRGTVAVASASPIDSGSLYPPQFINRAQAHSNNKLWALQSEMEEVSSMTKGRYKYVHDVKIGAPEAIDVHHIFISRSCANFLPLCSYALRLAAACFLIFALLQKTMSVYDLLMLDKPIAIVIWSFVVAGFLVRQILKNQVEKESVIILPAFGVQLETVYRSGETVHQFVPIDKILKPVLNECVTPVTCYWSLSLIVCGKDELLLVFKGLYPPITMLVPIWKALCAAIDSKERADMASDCDL